jgi:hypothetical protein
VRFCPEVASESYPSLNRHPQSIGCPDPGCIHNPSSIPWPRCYEGSQFDCYRFRDVKNGIGILVAPVLTTWCDEPLETIDLIKSKSKMTSSLYSTWRPYLAATWWHALQRLGLVITNIHHFQFRCNEDSLIPDCHSLCFFYHQLPLNVFPDDSNHVAYNYCILGNPNLIVYWECYIFPALYSVLVLDSMPHLVYLPRFHPSTYFPTDNI